MTLQNRKPMSRGKGFQRKQVAGRTPRETEAACGLPSDLASVEHHGAPAVRHLPSPTAPPVRRGTYTVTGKPVSDPKPEAHRNAHLLAMARGRPCLFLIGGVCNSNPETTVAAHSNWACHGKSGARKADDEYSAWCCSACHQWLDQGSADGELKKTAFMLAHLSQVDEWRRIAMLTSSTPADRRAAQWALDHLNATPVGAEGNL